MKHIEASQVIREVSALCGKAGTKLPADVVKSLETYTEKEQSPLGRTILQQCLDNALIAATEEVPICQDTGFAVLFVEMGAEVYIDGMTIEEACQEGIREGYEKYYLRKSIVRDPLYDRVNTRDNTPAVIHLSIVPGDALSITLAPKGGGSENMSKIAMLKPSDGEQGVIDFVVNSVINSGGNPCPPTIVGVGIGGTFEKCAFTAKKALLRTVGEPNANPQYAQLESKILEQINNSGVGPQGLGGNTTALAVHIETFPCHIAQMPVAVNLNCHAARHAEVVL